MTVTKERVDSRTVVVGAGYAGLPLGLTLSEAGRRTTLYDKDQDHVQRLERGQASGPDVGSERMRIAQSTGLLSVTASPTVLASADVVIICVPTPLGKNREPDLTYVREALNEIAAHQHPGMLVILESTVYPGMTREVALPLLTQGFEIGKEVFVGYSPERLDPGNAEYNLMNTAKVVSGVTLACLERVKSFYSCVFDRLVPVSSTDAAEMVKLLENSFRAVNIGLVNELAVAARKLGLDPFEVTRAAATKPFGFMPFSPGPGVGGHCIPVDPLYLNWKLASLNQEAKLIRVADSVNSSMPHYVVDRLNNLLVAEERRLEGSKILVYGVAYKANVSDTRESPALVIIQALRTFGSEVTYLDPWVHDVVVDGHRLRSAPSDVDFGIFDAVVIVTNHDALPKDQLCGQARLVLDTRDALSDCRASYRHIHVL